MAIQLAKGNGINLTKEVNNVAQALKEIKLGCGWKASRGYYTKVENVTKTIRKGFLGLGGTEQVVEQVERKYPIGAIDIDASVFAFKGNELVGKCYYMNQTMRLGGQIVAQSSGDNRQGSTGKKDDETITINIENIKDSADVLYLVLNIYGAYERKQHFNMVDNSYVRVYDDKGVEMAHFDLADDYEDMTGVIVGKLVKVDGVFQFVAMGDGVKVRGLSDMATKLQNL